MMEHDFNPSNLIRDSCDILAPVLFHFEIEFTSRNAQEVFTSSSYSVRSQATPDLALPRTKSMCQLALSVNTVVIRPFYLTSD